MTIKLGLIGYPLSHSFSKGYFTEKFKREHILNHEYDIYPLEKIEDVQNLFQDEQLIGLNVTIPYKEAVIPFLDTLDETAREIGAVNTIKISNNKKTGYNTDCYGFEMSFKPLLQTHHRKALVFGTGGASKAVVYVLKKLGIPFQYVSRTPIEGQWSYHDISIRTLQEYTILINTTPLGMYPQINTLPPIPYHGIHAGHYLYDLVYNPEVTLFLKEGINKGATIKNGLDMLYYQAEKAWNIWDSIKP
ncbi:MAG: shikimate dehydrogenase [Chitinophagales bacterium]|nr:shikimate dehydrogenase [Chitinophagales bacterium]MCZ2393602.1 shikimate dehydrogenase [Chitinophagales bacterium]